MAGDLTRLQMQTEVLDNLTQSAAMTTANSVTLAEMAQRWLNRAQTRISRMHNLIWDEDTTTTVANQKTYAFPSRLRSVKSMRLEDGLNSRKLICVMPDKLDQLYPKPDTQTTGKPTIYVPYENSDTFELFKIPDAGYVMRIRASFWPTPLTTDAQKSDFTYLDDVIIAYATMYGYQWLQEMNDSKFWRSTGDTELASQLKAEVSRFPDWAPIAEGFSAGEMSYVGEYYKDPFMRNDPNRVIF